MWTSGFNRLEHSIYILTEERNFKKFWKKIILLLSAVVKKMLNMELNMTLIVLMEFVCIVDIPEFYNLLNEYRAT